MNVFDSSRIDDDLRNAVVKIEESKKELEKAKVIRKNRQEYHALAKIINEHPDRLASIGKNIMLWPRSSTNT